MNQNKNPRKISLIGSRATSALSISLVLIIIGLCTTLGISVHRASSSLGDDTTIMVTLLADQDPLYASELKREFNDAPWVSKYDFTDAQTVLKREIDSMDSLTRQGLALLNTNPYGDEFIIYIADGWRSTDSISALTERLRATEGVDIVSDDAQTMGQTNTGMKRILFYLSILGLALLLISIVLINNTISLAIYSRRFTIHTMKLVGATNAFIRRPFVRAGMLTGVVAGVIAMFVVCGIQCYLMYNDDMVGQWLTTTDIVLTACCLVVLGALIARIAAWFAANNYLNKTYDKLFKK